MKRNRKFYFLMVGLGFVTQILFCQDSTNYNFLFQNWQLAKNTELSDSTLIFYRLEKEDKTKINNRVDYSIHFSKNGFGHAIGSIPPCGNDTNLWPDRWIFENSTHRVHHSFVENQKTIQSTTYEISFLDKKKLQLRLISQYYNDEGG